MCWGEGRAWLTEVVLAPRHCARQAFGIMGRHERCKLLACAFVAVRRAQLNPAGVPLVPGVCARDGRVGSRRASRGRHLL